MELTIPKKYIKLYSNYDQSSQTLKILKKYSTKNYTITDATAGIGGNAILFAKYYKQVNCVELNIETYNILKKNLKTMNNVNIIPDNYVNIYNKINQDIIFFDPPWEDNYKIKKYSNIFISNIDINIIIDSINDSTLLIALKCPLNFLCNVKNWTYNEFFIFKKTEKIYKLIILKKKLILK